MDLIVIKNNIADLDLKTKGDRADNNTGNKASKVND